MLTLVPRVRELGIACMRYLPSILPTAKAVHDHPRCGRAVLVLVMTEMTGTGLVANTKTTSHRIAWRMTGDRNVRDRGNSPAVPKQVPPPPQLDGSVAIERFA